MQWWWGELYLYHRPSKSLAPTLHRRERAIPACSCDLLGAAPPVLAPPSSTPRWCWNRSLCLQLQALSLSSTLP